MLHDVAEEDVCYFFNWTLTRAGMKTSYLENLSTNTKTNPKPSTFENPLMKSMDNVTRPISGLRVRRLGTR